MKKILNRKISIIPSEEGTVKDLLIWLLLFIAILGIAFAVFEGIEKKRLEAEAASASFVEELAGGDDREIYHLSGCSVYRFGERVDIYDEKGELLKSFGNIIDLYESMGEIYVSTFEQENFRISETGALEEMDSHYVRFPRGTQVLASDEDQNLITYDGQSLVIRYGDGDMKTISDVLDAHCAYGTLYFMDKEHSVFFVSPWNEKGIEEQLLVTGAYAVSPFSDESEGALVPEGKANWSGYGYSYIYSPWGDQERFPMD